MYSIRSHTYKIQLKKHTCSPVPRMNIPEITSGSLSGIISITTNPVTTTTTAEYQFHGRQFIKMGNLGGILARLPMPTS
jgi:hypothetical protein